MYTCPAHFRSWAFCLLFIVTGVPLVSLFGQPAEPYHVYRGLLHAHTAFSDGSGSPAEAYAMAKGEDIQFFAVTPHNHDEAERGAEERTDGVMIAVDHKLFESAETVTVTPNHGPSYQATSVIRAAREASTAAFVGLYGQEFSTISAGNHMNVIGYDKVLTNAKGDFRSLFETLDAYVLLGNPAPILQLNHPDVQSDLFYKGQNEETRKKMYNDYGFDDYSADFSELVSAAKYVSLIEILSGPAMAKTADLNYHYDHHHEDDYYFYLLQGFRISPSAGQDNHYKTWGRSSSARMGVLATSLTTASLFDAMRQNRTFVSEDKNLTSILTCNGKMMGESLDAAAGNELTFEVTVEDGDEPGADYEIVLVRGDIAPQKRATLVRMVASDGEIGTAVLHGNGKVTLESTVSGQPEFYYIRVTQNHRDRSWTAPIWINYPRASAAPSAESWVWTASPGSHVYHHSWCAMATTISSQNRRTGSTPPTGRTLHDCKRPVSDPEP